MSGGGGDEYLNFGTCCLSAPIRQIGKRKQCDLESASSAIFRATITVRGPHNQRMPSTANAPLCNIRDRKQCNLMSYFPAPLQLCGTCSCGKRARKGLSTATSGPGRGAGRHAWAGGGRRLREGLGVGLGRVRQALVHAWLHPQLPSRAGSAQARACAGGTWQRCQAKRGGGGGPRLREGLVAGLGNFSITNMFPSSRSAPRPAPPCAPGGLVCCGPGRGAGRHAGPAAAGDCARASGLVWDMFPALVPACMHPQLAVYAHIALASISRHVTKSKSTRAGARVRLRGAAPFAVGDSPTSG
jgi:hypothetical protein